ncbi:tRNA (guanine-N(7)-)-methyltransferase non-catalytic subunit WDR4 [Blattella germanica]|nr:tRNA (guanine-N(7)-)-methyltransferase non-catalytic subunit WDR4 [Blattella germanica]
MESKAEMYIVAGDISVSGRFLVLCTSNKLVSLWDAVSWTLLSNRVSARVASKVKFVPSEEAIVLADKSGDAYEFSVKCPHLEGKLLLGHLSMLLDILVTPNGRHIITCDRDEKIRVSCYPNSYNIKTYCLGHTEFVTNIFLLPHDESVLVSTSGDGTMRLWDYETGVQVYKIESNEDSTVYNDIIDEDQVEDNCALPVRLATSCIINSELSVLCCCLSKTLGCVIYKINGIKGNISHKLIQVIKLQAEPWDIICFDEYLWIIGPFQIKSLLVFTWDNKTSQFVEVVEKEILSVVEQVNGREDMFKNAVVSNELTLLYKRRFDNVQEYQKRKKQRLLGGLDSTETKMFSK